MYLGYNTFTQQKPSCGGLWHFQVCWCNVHKCECVFSFYLSPTHTHTHYYPTISPELHACPWLPLWREPLSQASDGRGWEAGEEKGPEQRELSDSAAVMCRPLTDTHKLWHLHTQLMYTSPCATLTVISRPLPLNRHIGVKHTCNTHNAHNIALKIHPPSASLSAGPYSANPSQFYPYFVF